MRLSLALIAFACLGFAPVHAEGAKGPAFTFTVGGESVRVDADGTVTATADGTGQHVKGTYTGKLTDAERLELEKAFPPALALPEPTEAQKKIGPDQTRVVLETTDKDGKTRRIEAEASYFVRADLKDLAKFTRIIDRLAPSSAALTLVSPVGTQAMVAGPGGDLTVVAKNGGESIVFKGEVNDEEKKTLLAIREKLLALPEPNEQEKIVPEGQPYVEVTFPDKNGLPRTIKANITYLQRAGAALKPAADFMQAAFARLSAPPSQTKGLVGAVAAAPK